MPVAGSTVTAVAPGISSPSADDAGCIAMDHLSRPKAKVVKGRICPISALGKRGLGDQPPLPVLRDKRAPAKEGSLDFEPEHRPWLKSVLTQAAFLD